MLSADLCPIVKADFPDDVFPLLNELIDLLDKCLKQNYIAAIVTIGCAFSLRNYSKIVMVVVLLQY